MKKIIFLLTLLGIFVGVYSSHTLIHYGFYDDQKQISCEDISFSNKKMKDNSSIEEQSTEEENLDVQVISSEITNYRDDYEDNESIETATYISPINFYNLDEYYVEINANLDTVAMIVDVDYYYFVVLSDSVVSITSTSSTVLESFDFNIYTYEYGTITNNTVNRDIVELYSDYTENGTKSYSATLVAGTYLIYMRGHQAYNSDIAIEYTLTLDVELVPFEQSVTTDSMVSTEYDGVIWISDYVPGDYIPLFDIDKEILFEQTGVAGGELPDYTLQIMDNITGYEIESQKREISVMNDLHGTEEQLNNMLSVKIDGEEIRGVHVATYYICNNVLRYVLYKAALELALYYDSVIETLNQTIEDYEMVEDTITNTIKVLAFAGGKYIDTLIRIPNASKILKYVSIAVVNAVFEIITPEISDNTTNMESFFNNLRHSLSMGISDDYEDDYDYIKSFPTTEIIFIPIYYYIRKTNTFGIEKKYVSYRATAAYNVKASYYPQYKTNIGNSISCNQEFDYFNRGKIYGLTSFSNISSIDSLSLYDENYHVHDYTDSYIHINTTHHYAYCRCGGRIRQGHAVVGSSKTCLQCGGSVDKGFVQMSLSNEIVDENTHVLDNGVVVLSEKDIITYLNGELTLKKKDEEF